MPFDFFKKMIGSPTCHEDFITVSEECLTKVRELSDRKQCPYPDRQQACLQDEQALGN
ncbi:hypothetical protein PHLCEN_2v5963 [Hermanssonia centrifuga]|uniref:Uncharacterized protein n=1 Tax=Hermanssonia centrifuga TaxID=98765 RepID=A0A2R6P0T5_9APHY|nr:hypothetical protein PHLCEN_2v5963 [Hermanssonia centrifuga]